MLSKTASIRYARALFDVAIREKADLDRIEQELAGFENLFAEYPAWKKVMLNPAVPVPRKRAAMADLTAYANTSPIVAKLLVLLAERDRLIVLPDLLAAYRDRLMTHRNVVRAEVTTSTPLVKEAADQIGQRLERVTGRTVFLQTRVDPAIIGGLVARVGGTVYDASVTRQLEKMRDQLAEGV
jgi:F-type H+-transporting ATPase subunit delta